MRGCLGEGAGWIHEIKHDGFRMMVRRNGVGIRLFTRNGYDWTDRYPLKAAHALRAMSFLLDGRSGQLQRGRPSGFRCRWSPQKQSDIFFICVRSHRADGRDLRRESIEVRKTALAKLLRRADYGIFLTEYVEDEAEIVFGMPVSSA